MQDTENVIEPVVKKDTWFWDLDGSIFIYRQFENYTNEKAVLIEGVCEFMNEKNDNGDCIVITTARPESLREFTENELRENNIPYKFLLMGIERGHRHLVNDSDSGSDTPRAIAYSLLRNEPIHLYLKRKNEIRVPYGFNGTTYDCPKQPRYE